MVGMCDDDSDMMDRKHTHFKSDEYSKMHVG